MKAMRSMGIVLLAGLLLTSAASAGVIQLSWAPWQAGDPGTSGDWLLYANIASADAVVGWGLDLYLPPGASLAAVDAHGPLWSDIYAASPDPNHGTAVALNFAAIGTYPPGSVSGSNVLLAALTLDPLVTNPFVQVTLGSDENGTPADLNEGFARNPPPTGAFVPWTVIPEPATLALWLVGMAVLARRHG
jgi:hypothetical protein